MLLFVNPMGFYKINESIEVSGDDIKHMYYYY